MKLFKEVINKNIKMIIFYTVLGIIINFINLYCINYLQNILNLFIKHTLDINLILFYGILLIISTLLGYLDNYPEQTLKNGLYLDFKLMSLKKMKTIIFSDYQKIGTGKLIQRIEDGSTAAREVIFQFWLRLIREIIPITLFSLIFIYFIEKRILIFILIGYILIIIITNILLKKLYNLKENILVNQESLNKRLVRGFMELVVFRINKKYDIEIKKSNDEADIIVKNKTKIKLIHELFFSLFSILVGILKIIILIYGLLSSNLSVGAMATLFILIEKIYEPIAIFNVEYIDYNLNLITLKRYLEFLNIEDDNALNTGKVISKIEGNIKFQNIDFSYSNKNIVENLSLEIKENEIVALVGESGSGKSTIVKLITGLIKPVKGEILIDNNNLSKLNLSSHYDHVSYLNQETPIFDGTLKENLVFDKNINEENIKEVLKLVCLEEFYKKLENGLETELGEKGTLISGGEKQRISLARLFFENSKIVILDEATSSMDAITEEIVMKNIINNLSNKTLIIIAHRLNTIKNVDKIFVLKDGKIIEKGKFNHLLSINGYFKKLYNSNKIKKSQ